MSLVCVRVCVCACAHVCQNVSTTICECLLSDMRNTARLVTCILCANAHVYVVVCMSYVYMSTVLYVCEGERRHKHVHVPAEKCPELLRTHHLASTGNLVVFSS